MVSFVVIAESPVGSGGFKEGGEANGAWTQGRKFAKDFFFNVLNLKKPQEKKIERKNGKNWQPLKKWRKVD